MRCERRSADGPRPTSVPAQPTISAPLGVSGAGTTIGPPTGGGVHVAHVQIALHGAGQVGGSSTDARTDLQAPGPRIMSTRLSARFFLVVLLATPVGVIAQAGQNGTLLVANRTGGSISLFDLGTRVEMARVPIGPIIPHEVAVSPDGRLALTSEYGPDDNPGRHLVVIDVAEGRQAGRIDLGPQSRPHSIVFMKDGQRAVATLELSDRVALVDVPGQKVIRMYPTGGREGHMVRLSPDGTRAYVTSRGAAGTCRSSRSRPIRPLS